MAEDNSNIIDPKILLLVVIVAVFASIAGYLFIANKKMMESGVHQELNKKRKK
jgi:uncharacterized membrane protein (DUF106 family)